MNTKLEALNRKRLSNFSLRCSNRINEKPLSAIDIKTSPHTSYKLSRFVVEFNVTMLWDYIRCEKFSGFESQVRQTKSVSRLKSDFAS